MRTRRLGSAGPEITTVGFGSWAVGGPGKYGWGAVDDGESIAAIRHALDSGVNWIDTAAAYGLGHSEEIVGKAIEPFIPGDNVYVFTKCGRSWYASESGKDLSYDLRPGSIRYECEESLKRLGVERIDLYQLHGFDPLTPLEEVLSTLNDMVRSGKVRYIGLCNMAAWQIMKGLAISEKNHWARFESVQAYYTVAGRDLEREVLPLLQDQQLGLMVWSPLAGGLLSGKFAPDGKGPEGARRASFDFPLVDKARAFRVLDAMRPIAQRHQVSVAQVALAWLLSRPQVSTVIVGAKTPAQLEDNLGATQLELTADELAALDEVSALPPEYPGWMLARQGQNRAKPPVKV